MPTAREDFLSNGLRVVPEESAVDQAGNCSVCMDVLREELPTDVPNIVSLPCKHIFHNRCIRQWLMSDGRNSCPACRLQLFEDDTTYHDSEDDEARARQFAGATPNWVWGEIPDRDGEGEDDGEGEADSTSSDDAYGAELLQRTHVSPASQRFNEHVETSRMARAGFPPSHFFLHIADFHEIRYEDAFIEAEGFAMYTNRRRPRDGVSVKINAPAFLYHITAMANLLPTLARAQGRPYTARDVDHWDRVVSGIWRGLRHSQGRVYSVSDIIQHMLDTIMGGWQPPAVRRSDFARGAPAPGRRSKFDDCECLLAFIVHLARKEFEEPQVETRVEE